MKPVRRKRAAAKPRRRRCLRQGDACPRCRQGRLEYNGLIQLACPRCGYAADPGGFT